ncbi:MAG: SRPBCC domain-containing protein [Nannocystaceae bacterium]
MTTTLPHAPSLDGRCHRDRTTFSLTYAVGTIVAAPAERLWSLLTDAAGFPHWNTTVESIEGSIAAGERIAVRVPIAPGRVFKLRVGDVVPQRAMTWRDGMPPMFRGVRSFVLVPRDDGRTEFHMVERFAGLMLPMIAKALPDFGPVFERYAADLARAAVA